MHPSDLIVFKYLQYFLIPCGCSLALTLRYTKAALVIQKTYRMVAVRQLFLMIRRATVTIQAFTRGTLTRRRYRMVSISASPTSLSTFSRNIKNPAGLICSKEKPIKRFTSPPTVGGRAGHSAASGHGPWVAGTANIQANTRSGGVHAVLRAPQGCQERAAEAQSRGPLGGEVQRTQQGHGSQADAAAAESRPGGGWQPFKPAGILLSSMSRCDLTL